MSEYRIYMDGDAWCAVAPGFVNLQESPAGFGRDPQAALQALVWELDSIDRKKAVDDEILYIHEDAEDFIEFAFPEPRQALEAWLRHGIGTDEFDPDREFSTVKEITEGEHLICKMKPVVIRDEEHLRELQDECDSQDDFDWESMKVGYTYYKSIGLIRYKVELKFDITFVPKECKK